VQCDVYFAAWRRKETSFKSLIFRKCKCRSPNELHLYIAKGKSFPSTLILREGKRSAATPHYYSGSLQTPIKSAPFNAPNARVNDVLHNPCCETVKSSEIYRSVSLLSRKCKCPSSNELHLHAKTKSFLSVYGLNVSVQAFLGSRQLPCISVETTPLKSAPSRGGIAIPSNTWFLGPTRVFIPNSISIGSAVFCTSHRKVSLYTLQWAASSPKKPFPLGDRAPSNTRFRGSTRVTTPNGISIGLVVFDVTKRQTERQTGRSRYSVCRPIGLYLAYSNRPLSLD